MNELKSPDKPFEISKWAVQEAWEKVKANKGAPGVDEVTIEAFVDGTRILTPWRQVKIDPLGGVGDYSSVVVAAGGRPRSRSLSR